MTVEQQQRLFKFKLGGVPRRRMRCEGMPEGLERGEAIGGSVEYTGPCGQAG